MTSARVVFACTLLLAVSSIWHVESLQSNYYATTCPQAQPTIDNIVRNAVKKNPRAGAGFIRLFFHDCFVRGCDASVLIDSPSNNAEKDAPPNRGLNDLDIIDQIKTAVESFCPKTVSCADIIAFTAATSLSALGGPSVDIQGGRFDGRISRSSEASSDLPPPFRNLSATQAFFDRKGLNTRDFVALSGSHTVGKSQCSAFSARIRNFSSTAQVDPSLDSTYAKSLRKACPVNVASSKVVNMDRATPTLFDNQYYKDVQARRGLFTTDAALLTSDATKKIVDQFAQNNAFFLQQFAASFVKMGKIGVRTRRNIRTNCRSIS